MNTLFAVAILEGNWRLGCRFRERQPDTSLIYYLNGLNSIDKYRTAIQPDNAKLKFHEKKVLKAIAEVYREKGDKAKAIFYFTKALYSVAYFPDRQQHNASVNREIAELERQ